MKPLLVSTFALLVLVTLAPSANADQSCSLATLKGNYGFTFSGFSISGSTAQPFSGVGLGTFDGEGNFSSTFDFSINGVPFGTPFGTHPFSNPYTARYTVYGGCSGSLQATISGGDDFSFVIVQGGAEILAVDISSPDTITLDFKKISESQ
jgi:hypothetical protein